MAYGIEKVLASSAAVLALALGNSGTSYGASCDTTSASISGSPFGVSTEDMSFNGSPAMNCAELYAGPPGLPQVQAIATQLGWGSPYEGPLANLGHTILGISWDLSNTGTGTGMGTWTLDYEPDPAVSKVLGMIGILNTTDDEWAAFWFGNSLLFQSPGSSDGTFALSWCNVPGTAECFLSDISLYFVAGSSGSVPEPGSLALVGISLAAIGLLLIRRRKFIR